MKKYTFIIFSILCTAIFCSCSNDRETPPLSRERTQLILRLFESLEKGDKTAVITRAEKLKKVLPDNDYIGYVIETQIANTYITHAQKAINEGHEKLALKILEKGLQKHPLNRTLQTQHAQLKMLCDIENAVNSGKLTAVPANLQQIPQYGPILVKKMQAKNIPLERKD